MRWRSVLQCGTFLQSFQFYGFAKAGNREGNPKMTIVIKQEIRRRGLRVMVKNRTLPHAYKSRRLVLDRDVAHTVRVQA